MEIPIYEARKKKTEDHQKVRHPDGTLHWVTAVQRRELIADLDKAGFETGDVVVLKSEGMKMVIDRVSSCEVVNVLWQSRDGVMLSRTLSTKLLKHCVEVCDEF